MRKKKKLYIGTLALIFFSVVLVCVYSLPAKQREFNSKEWKDCFLFVFRRSYPYPTTNGNTQRVEMLDDLLLNHLHIGMSRWEVIELLGTPSVTDSNGDNGEKVTEIFDLVEAPILISLWQMTLLLRYGTAEPTLYLRFRDDDNRLIDIAVE